MVLHGEYIRHDTENNLLDINVYEDGELINRELYDKDSNLIYLFQINKETKNKIEKVNHPLIQYIKINGKYDGKFILNTYEKNKTIKIKNVNMYEYLMEIRDKTFINIEQYIECEYKNGIFDGIYLEYLNKELIIKSSYNKGKLYFINKYRNKNLISKKNYDFNTGELIRFEIYNKQNKVVYKMIKQNNNIFETVDTPLLKATLLNDKFIGKYQEFEGELNGTYVRFFDESFINLPNQVLKHLDIKYQNLKQVKQNNLINHFN